MLARRAVPLTLQLADLRLPVATCLKPPSAWPSLAKFRCNVTSFRINTCENVSIQATLSSFRINTYKKNGGEGPPRFTNSPLATLHFPPHSSSFFSHSCALFCAFLQSSKNQPFHFQAIPNSLLKKRDVGGSPPSISDPPLCEPSALSVSALSFIYPPVIPVLAPT